MANLTHLEKRKFEQLLGMGSGYVLNFTNSTFRDFVTDSVGHDIEDARYDNGSNSKAQHLRKFWLIEGNRTVGKLMGDLLNYGVQEGLFNDNAELLELCRRTVTRLLQAGPVSDAEALTAITSEKDFETVAQAVRGAINTNQPETGLDRLHTFVAKYLRTLCEKRGITITKEKPLHSLLGEYIKRLQADKHIHSEMTLRILKNSISILEAFNDVRNNQSLAHDNDILNYEEALLIFNQVAISIRCLRNLEERLQQTKKAASTGRTSNF